VSGVANPWLSRRVLCYAHQGGALEAPSSTLFALRRALEAGADALELDVHATADAHLVVCHDPTVDRTTEGTGAIAGMTLAEVESLDNAYWFVPGLGAVRDRPPEDYPLRGRAASDPELRVATLDAVLEAFPDVPINLDIKQTAPAVAAYEDLVAETLARHGRRDGVIVASFIDAATATFRRHEPSVATSAGTEAVAAFYRAVRASAEPPALDHVALQVPVRVGELVIIDEQMVETAHSEGLAIHAWTVDEPEEMAPLVGMGVDGIMSDRPSVLAGVLDDLGARWQRPG
jgi:glycerophosphoryl diester phosphodiesterase